MNLLLVGVGGVGCEFLILLSEVLKSDSCCLTGLNDGLTVTIVDDDIVEESNLSRQRLYRRDDIGKAKVEAAAAVHFNFKVIPVKRKLEDIKDAEFFNRFSVFVLAVDNLETRRWLNSTIKNYIDDDEWLLVDMGVQGFKFSIRTVRPDSACLECTMSLYSVDDAGEMDIPVCSIYGQPRNLKDCVYWSISTDDTGSINEHDVSSVFDLTVKRAKEFGIDSSELSYEFIESLMKRAIPAVASVNSLLAAKAIDVAFVNRSRLNFWMVNLECGYYEMSTRLQVSETCMYCRGR